MGKYHVYVPRTGITEIVENKDDFSALLRDLIGEDAAEYFDVATSPKSIIGETDEDEFAEKGFCRGECICVQRVQEHFVQHWRNSHRSIRQSADCPEVEDNSPFCAEEVAEYCVENEEDLGMLDIQDILKE